MSSLADIADWALSVKSPSRPSSVRRRRRFERPGSRTGRRSPRSKQTRRSDESYQEHQDELAAIQSTSELIIDHTRVLSVKGGDLNLNVLQGETYRCTPAAAGLKDIPLILKRVECLDRRAYDLRVYEADTFQRFRDHPNVTAQYNYWSEDALSPYAYKTLVLLYQEGVGGNAGAWAARQRRSNPSWRPSPRQALKLLSDTAKGLLAFHNAKVIHARVKPTSLYLAADNTVMLGELGKVELDAARSSHHYFSKVLIGAAIPHVLVYWAPELLKLESYGPAIDMWALGVTVFELITGQFPFPVDNENAFRSAVLEADVEWNLLAGYPRVEEALRGLLVVDPWRRWTSQEVITFVTSDYAVDVQRVWQGYQARKDLNAQREAAVKVQSLYRGHSAKKDFFGFVAARKNEAASTIASNYRRYRDRKRFRAQVRALQQCQANVLARQQRQRFEFLRGNAAILQVAARTYLALKWREQVQERQRELEARAREVLREVELYQDAADAFASLFPEDRIPAHMQHLQSVAAFDRAQCEWSKAAGHDVHPSGLSSPRALPSDTAEIESLRARLEVAERALRDRDAGEGELRTKLGRKFDEYHPMVERLQQRLAKIARMTDEAVPLTLSLAREIQYSAWDRAHEPDNIADNCLVDDASEWRSLSPMLDLALEDGTRCFIASVEITIGDCGPSRVGVYLSNTGDLWDHYQDFDHLSDTEMKHTLWLRGEATARYIRLQMPNNTRGGNYVSIRNVTVNGQIVEQPGSSMSRTGSRRSVTARTPVAE